MNSAFISDLKLFIGLLHYRRATLPKQNDKK